MSFDRRHSDSCKFAQLGVMLTDRLSDLWLQSCPLTPKRKSFGCEPIVFLHGIKEGHVCTIKIHSGFLRIGANFAGMLHRTTSLCSQPSYHPRYPRF